MKGYGGSNFGGTISPVAFRGKKPVATYNDLPVTNNEPNDLRAVADTDHLYMWTLDTPSGNLGDWADIGSTVGNLDTIADGSTYGKTLLSELKNPDAYFIYSDRDGNYNTYGTTGIREVISEWD